MLCVDKGQDDLFGAACKWLTKRTFSVLLRKMRGTRAQLLPRSGGSVKGRVSTNCPLRNQSNITVTVLFLWTRWELRSTLRGFLLLLFSCSVVSNSLWPHGLQYTRLPRPLLSPRACSNSRPLSRWCHPTISSSVTSFCGPQSFPASRSFPLSHLMSLLSGWGYWTPDVGP